MWKVHVYLRGRLFCTCFATVRVAAVLLRAVVKLLAAGRLSFLAGLTRLLGRCDTVVSCNRYDRLHVLIYTNSDRSIRGCPVVFRSDFSRGRVCSLLHGGEGQVRRVVRHRMTRTIPRKRLSRPSSRTKSVTSRFRWE